MIPRLSPASQVSWIVATRVLLFGALVATTTAVPRSWTAWTLLIVYGIGNAGYLLHLLLRDHGGAAGQEAHRGSGAALFALMLLELALESTLVLVDGGYHSDFSLLFLLTITLGGFLFRLWGGVVLAVIATAFFGTIGVIHVAFPENALGLMPLSITEAEFRFLMIVGSGFALATLSGHFSASFHAQQQVLAGTSRDLELARLDLDGVLNRLTYGVLVIDPTGQLLYFNQAAAGLLTYPLHPGASLARILALEAWAPPLLELCDQVLASGSPGELECQPEVGKWLRLQVAGTWIDGKLRNLVLTLHDISAIRRMEAEVRNAERMATLGTMAARIAHEIRNPLASITGSAQLLADQPALGSDDQVLLRLIRRESERLDRILAEFLDFSRTRAPAPRRLALPGLLEEVRQVILQRASVEEERDIHVRVTCDHELDAFLDRDMLQQVLVNLGLNSYQALSAERPGEIILESSKQGKTLKLTVRDNGMGMSNEILQRSVEVFFTTKAGGSGLGLSICKQLVSTMGGSMRIRSREGKGTAVDLLFPDAVIV